MPTTPVTERILANLVSTLSGVSAGVDYFHTFRHVAVIDGAVVAEHKMPAAFIRPLYTDMDGEGQTLTNAIRHEMRCSITLAIESRTGGRDEARGGDARRDPRALIWIRSGAPTSAQRNAVNTIVDQVERAYPDGTQLDVYLATLIVRVIFRTRADDLGVSL